MLIKIDGCVYFALLVISAGLLLVWQHTQVTSGATNSIITLMLFGHKTLVKMFIDYSFEDK